MSEPSATGAPSLEYLMASVIRLMAACTEDDCPSRQRTLLHLLNYLLKHPGLAVTPGAEGAVRQAMEIWSARSARHGLTEGGQNALH
jgi:hypothetical protein